MLDKTYESGLKDRFVDDQTFVSLVGMRSAASKRLLSAIGEQVHLVDQYTNGKIVIPSGIFKAVLFLSKFFLGDKELPYRWRFSLWCRFIGRYLAVKGFIYPRIR